MLHLAHGVIRLDPEASLAVRLVVIDTELTELVARYQPDVGSVETLFFHKDAQAAAKLGHARGVVLAALARAGVEVAEYAPAHVKRTVAGRGQASKQQVALMVRAVLALDEMPRNDATDALALAVTHLRVASLQLGASARRRAPTTRKSGQARLRALVAAQARR